MGVDDESIFWFKVVLILCALGVWKVLELVWGLFV